MGIFNKIAPILLLFKSVTCLALVHVTAGNGHYDGQLLILEGEVIIEDALGKLEALSATLERASHNDATFSKLTLTGSVKVTLPTGGTLFCSRVDGDLIRRHFVFYGEPELQFKDIKGELLAKHGELFYEEIEGKVVLTALHLYDGIRLMRKEPLQYALADRVDYFPKDKHYIFEGSVRAPVLFVDESTGMNVSAEKIIASESGSEIKGVGNVKFVFQEEEVKKLQQTFQWKKKNS